MAKKPATALLGQNAPVPQSPEEAILDPRAQSASGHVLRRPLHLPGVHLDLPVTGQPDFGILVIDYVPGKWLVESKSLKLYLTSFRNHGAFHEDCTVGIGKRLVDLLKPTWFRIGGYWYPRGGIPIDVFWQTGKLPANVFLPDQGFRPIGGGERRRRELPASPHPEPVEGREDAPHQCNPFQPPLPAPPMRGLAHHMPGRPHDERSAPVTTLRSLFG